MRLKRIFLSLFSFLFLCFCIKKMRFVTLIIPTPSHPSGSVSVTLCMCFIKNNNGLANIKVIMLLSIRYLIHNVVILQYILHNYTLRKRRWGWVGILVLSCPSVSVFICLSACLSPVCGHDLVHWYMDFSENVYTDYSLLEDMHVKFSYIY